MKIGILGTGNVGRTLAAALAGKGHAVRMGSRDPGGKERATGDAFSAWRSEHRAIPLGTYTDAAAHGEVVLVATAGHSTLEALGAAGAESLGDKILLDITNPLDFSQGMPPTLFVSNRDSLGERIQAAFPRTRVVKTLNTVTASLMVDPLSLAEGQHDIFVCGNDKAARTQVSGWLREWFGWKSVVDLGDITMARGTEAYLLLWVRMWGALGTARFNLRLVKA